ncbi:MAG: helix-turn-helix domain-containing protein [Gammaproteobacteria bacterium]|nr:helix-turn-helix domain-containing protein [Gammaproteobacteria bacterium]
MTNKKLYSIGEAARETGYSSETIRRLEREHNLVKPIRVNGSRIFSENDLATIRRWKTAHSK